jgi:hypothetical protein
MTTQDYGRLAIVLLYIRQHFLPGLFVSSFKQQWLSAPTDVTMSHFITFERVALSASHLTQSAWHCLPPPPE